MRNVMKYFGAALALALTGCGNVTSGGVGEVEVVLAPDELGDVTTSITSALSPSILQAPGDSIEGTLTVQVRSFARRSGGDFEELTDGPQRITVSLFETDPVQIARRSLSAGRYEAVRTFFSQIEVDVTRGLVIDGVSIEGTVTVDLDSIGTLSVVDFSEFEVYEDASTVIALEMQTRLWLRLVNAVARRVDVTDFRRIFRVRIQRVTES